MIGLVGAHGDAFEILELAEEVLDEMAPLVHLFVDGERLCAARMLGDDRHGAAFWPAARNSSKLACFT